MLGMLSIPNFVTLPGILFVIVCIIVTININILYEYFHLCLKTNKFEIV